MLTWITAHPGWVFMLVAVGAVVGLFVGSLCRVAGDADAAAEVPENDEALRARMAWRDEWPS